MVATASSAPRGASSGRMAAVQDAARLLRRLFEFEREFIRTSTTLIYRVGEPELKYLLCQHGWESAGHARFLRERGREMNGFGSDETIRPDLQRRGNEAGTPEDTSVALARFYPVLRPALHDAYRRYLGVTHHLADWPTRRLVEEFLGDEERHAAEMQPWLASPDSPSAQSWTAHLTHALAVTGGVLGDETN